MLDPWIIDEIRRREEEERHERERPQLEIPLDVPVYPTIPGHGKKEESEERGVVIVEFHL
jgi:hypothetical protein